MSVNIKGIRKTELLKALWEKSSIAGFYPMTGLKAPEFDEKRAEEAVKGYIDYFQGRVIKCNISGDTAIPYLYDRDNGPGLFEIIVSKLREQL